MSSSVAWDALFVAAVAGMVVAHLVMTVAGHRPFAQNRSLRDRLKYLALLASIGIGCSIGIVFRPHGFLLQEILSYASAAVLAACVIFALVRGRAVGKGNPGTPHGAQGIKR
jgi:predicted membrane protein